MRIYKSIAICHQSMYPWLEMIQDIAPHKFHNEYRKDAAPGNDSPVLCFNERKMLVSVTDNAIAFPTYEQIGKPEEIVWRWGKPSASCRDLNTATFSP